MPTLDARYALSIVKPDCDAAWGPHRRRWRLRPFPSRSASAGEGRGGRAGTGTGDARLTLAREAPGAFDLLLVDAFSSDSVPTHLMTVQSMRTYLRVLKPGGVAVVHLSNRNLALLPPAAAAVRAAGGVPLEQLFMASGSDTYAESSSHVMIFAHDAATLAPYRASGKWFEPTHKGRAWTDDYTNIVGAMIARYRGGVDG